MLEEFSPSPKSEIRSNSPSMGHSYIIHRTFGKVPCILEHALYSFL